MDTARSNRRPKALAPRVRPTRAAALLLALVLSLPFAVLALVEALLWLFV